MTALLALGDGEAAALAGELTAGVYTGKDGTPRPKLDLVVLTEYHVTRRRRAIHEPAGAGAEEAQPREATTHYGSGG